MSEEIIIKTEIVKVEDLKGREKQIWEHGYQKGFKDAPLARWTKADTVRTIFLSIIIVGLWWNALKLL